MLARDLGAKLDAEIETLLATRVRPAEARSTHQQKETLS